MKKFLTTLLPILAIIGCATTSNNKNTCESTAESTITYTGNADECACEAQSVIDYYNDQTHTQGIINISYSSDEEMHAQSCQKAILKKDSGFKINMIQDKGTNVYGYSYPMSKTMW